MQVWVAQRRVCTRIVHKVFFNHSQQLSHALSPARCGFRMLGNHEIMLIYEHFLRLSLRERNMRFSGVVDQELIYKYCYRRGKSNPLTVGFFVEHRLRAVGELFVGTAEREQGCCEIALSVETSYQNQKVGSMLLKKLLLLAEASGASSVCLFSLQGNTPLQKISQKHCGIINHSGNQLEIEIPVCGCQGIESAGDLKHDQNFRSVA